MNTNNKIISEKISSTWLKYKVENRDTFVMIKLNKSNVILMNPL